MNKSKKAIAIVVNLRLKEDSLNLLRNKKNLIPVSGYRIGTKIFNLEDKEDFKKKILLILNKHSSDFEEIERILNMHNIGSNNILITFALHFKKDDTYINKDKIYNYTDQIPIENILDEIDKIYDDIVRYVNINNHFNYFNIKDTLEVFSEVKDFIEVIEKK